MIKIMVNKNITTLPQYNLNKLINVLENIMNSIKSCLLSSFNLNFKLIRRICCLMHFKNLISNDRNNYYDLFIIYVII
jgi:hypothetical protein